MAGNAITGREGIFGGKKKSGAWNTAGEQVGAGDLRFIDNDGLVSSHAVEQLVQSSTTMPFPQDINVGRETLAGNLTEKLRFQGFDYIFAAILGNAQTKTGGGPYDMKVYTAAEINDLIYTHVVKMATDEVYEVPSVKLHGYSMSGEFGQVINIDTSAIGSVLLKTSDAAITNTITDINQVTVDDNVKKNTVVWDANSEMLLQLESTVVTNGALAAGTDEIFMQSFTHSFDRPMDSVYNGEAGNRGINEPKGNDDPTIMFNFDLFEYTTVTTATAPGPTGTQLKGWLNSDVYLSGRFKLARSANFEFYIWMPRMKITSCGPAITSKERIVTPVECQVLKSDLDPGTLGMADANLYLQIVNQESSDPV